MTTRTTKKKKISRFRSLANRKFNPNRIVKIKQIFRFAGRGHEIETFHLFFFFFFVTLPLKQKKTSRCRRHVSRSPLKSFRFRITAYTILCRMHIEIYIMFPFSNYLPQTYYVCKIARKHTCGRVEIISILLGPKM